MTKANIKKQPEEMKSKTNFHAEGLCSPTWHFDRLHFFEDLAGEKNYYSQDAARSRSVKGKYLGHRGQRSRSLCNFSTAKMYPSNKYNIFTKFYYLPIMRHLTT